MRQAPIIAAALLCSCAWAPVVHRYPSGLTVVRGDKTLLAQACANALDITPSGNVKRVVINDSGQSVKASRIVGCYQKHDDTIYVRNTNDGAKALLHELAHRDGVKDPAADGYDW